MLLLAAQHLLLRCRSRFVVLHLFCTQMKKGVLSQMKAQ